MKFDAQQPIQGTDIAKQSSMQSRQQAQQLPRDRSMVKEPLVKDPDVKDPIMAQQYQPLQEQQHQEQQASGGVDALKGKWQQQVGAAKIVWGKLTDDELLKSEGHHQKLAGLVQERYAITRVNADEQVTKFLAMATI
jgi:uncharacterized protein YjbJ (UPF0337 family)